MKKKLALTKDGKLTYCTSSEENIGKGRCNHIAHQKENESNNDFLERCYNYNNYNGYDNNFNKNDSNKNMREYFKDQNLSIVNKLYREDIFVQDFSKNIGGSQPKTSTVNNEYIKFDNIELDDYGKIDSKFSYPSITESICSSVLRHSNIPNKIRCANYYFGIYMDNDMNDKYGCSSFSISENYRQNFENEYILASPYGSGQASNSIMRTDDYRDEIFETLRPKESQNIIIDSIMKKFKNCDRIKLEDQFVNKCAIDILFGNKDIRNNPGNFIIVCNENENSQPDIVSMDYGRCIHFSESNTYMSKNEIINNIYFKPYEININEIRNECKQMKIRIRENIQLCSFIDITYDRLINNLNKNKELWIDISN